MNIVLQIVNARGDELGRLPLQTVRIGPSGASAAPPDLRGDMAQAEERIALALAQEGMAPALDSIGLRLAVSRALLGDGGEGDVMIPVPISTDSGSTRAAVSDGPVSGGVTLPRKGRSIVPPVGIGESADYSAESVSHNDDRKAAPSDDEWDDMFDVPDIGDGPSGEGGDPDDYAH